MASPQYNDILPFVLPFVGNLPDARSAVEAGGAGATSPLGRRWFFEAEAWLAPGTAAQALEMGARAGREDVVLAALPRCSDKDVLFATDAAVIMAERGLVRCLEALAAALAVAGDDAWRDIDCIKSDLLGYAMRAAAKAGQVECVRAMLGAMDVRGGLNHVRVSISLAANNRQHKCLEVLLGVNVDIPASEFRYLSWFRAPSSALMKAAKNGDPECIRVILAARNVCEVDRKEAAWHAAESRVTNLAECIAALGFDEAPPLPPGHVRRWREHAPPRPVYIG